MTERSILIWHKEKKWHEEIKFFKIQETVFCGKKGWRWRGLPASHLPSQPTQTA
jgi:hypothetical protein